MECRDHHGHETVRLPVCGVFGTEAVLTMIEPSSLRLSGLDFEFGPYMAWKPGCANVRLPVRGRMLSMLPVSNTEQLGNKAVRIRRQVIASWPKPRRMWCGRECGVGVGCDDVRLGTAMKDREDRSDCLSGEQSRRKAAFLRPELCAYGKRLRELRN